ncbi:MAG: TonB-dependent receptor plug domain-containing protein [Tannerellaceae bacterium]
MEFMRKTELPFNWIKGFCKLNSLVVASLLFSTSQNTAAETLIGIDVPTLTQAQKGTVIKGIVVDEKGEAVIGANVTVKSDPKVGVITDMDGNFTIDVPAGTILQITYIGYTPQDIVAKAGAPMKVRMVEDTQTLSEVVVVGYGSMDKKELTSAVVSVKSKDFLQGAANNPIQMIDGKVAGVTVSGYGAADPNRDPMSSLQVRGAGSLDAGNGPLIVIDGMPGGDLRNVANQDIESITVLKDGSAAAIYGSRAANGVVIVQTK